MPQASSIPSSSSQQEQTTQPLEVLRVAHQELSSGNQRGQVFVQLSPGAVALHVDRPVAQARVSRLLHQAIEKEESS